MNYIVSMIGELQGVTLVATTVNSRDCKKVAYGSWTIVREMSVMLQSSNKILGTAHIHGPFA